MNKEGFADLQTNLQVEEGLKIIENGEYDIACNDHIADTLALVDKTDTLITRAVNLVLDRIGTKPKAWILEKYSEDDGSQRIVTKHLAGFSNAVDLGESNSSDGTGNDRYAVKIGFTQLIRSSETTHLFRKPSIEEIKNQMVGVATIFGTANQYGSHFAPLGYRLLQDYVVLAGIDSLDPEDEETVLSLYSPEELDLGFKTAYYLNRNFDQIEKRLEYPNSTENPQYSEEFTARVAA